MGGSLEVCSDSKGGMLEGVVSPSLELGTELGRFDGIEVVISDDDSFEDAGSLDEVGFFDEVGLGGLEEGLAEDAFEEDSFFEETTSSRDCSRDGS